MPVRRTLLVEGKLDFNILGAVFQGDPAIPQEFSSKNALAPKARAEQKKGLRVYYIRDRDFDHDPPTDCALPEADTFDRDRQNAILGWRWCRHSMENYLLDPALVTAATAIDEQAYRQTLAEASEAIRYYQAARWTKGIARRALLPPHAYQTCPDGTETDDFFLPGTLSGEASWEWVRTSSEAFIQNISEALSGQALREHFESKCAMFSEGFVRSSEQVLLWFSGKNLLQALAPWLQGLNYPNPGLFRARIRDWIQRNPEETLGLLPEWQNFLNMIRSLS